jgi:CheY-like chemotaxis protein
MKKVNCILLVDDNPSDNYFHKYIIERAGVCDHIESVFNGHDGLAYLTKAGDPNFAGSFPKPDIILLDINMPRMNGFEFIEAYDKLEERLKSRVIVVMLTISIKQEDRDKALQKEHVKEFINKPLSMESIRELVEKYF